MTRSTDRYEIFHRQVNVDRWRSLVVWGDTVTGRESLETVGWSATTAGEAIATVAAYFPPRWLPVEDGQRILRAEVRLGRFTESRTAGGALDLAWLDEGPAQVGAAGPDGIEWGAVEIPSGDQQSLFGEVLV